MLIRVWGAEKRYQWEAGRQAGHLYGEEQGTADVSLQRHSVSSTLHTLIMRTGLWLSRHAWEEKMIWREKRKAETGSLRKAH